LIHLLNKLATAETPLEDQQQEDRIKPATIVTVKDISESFNERLMSLTRDYNEIILVFDTCRDDSMKSATRDKKGKEENQSSIR